MRLKICIHLLGPQGGYETGATDLETFGPQNPNVRNDTCSGPLPKLFLPLFLFVQRLRAPPIASSKCLRQISLQASTSMSSVLSSSAAMASRMAACARHCQTPTHTQITADTSSHAAHYPRGSQPYADGSSTRKKK